MKKNAFVIGGWLLSTILIISSCKKDSQTVDTTNNGTFKVCTVDNITTVQNLVADTIIGIIPNGPPFGSGKNTFFSLEQKAMVANSDSNTTKWDLAFKSTTIGVNAGISGPGNGGAFIWNGVFESLTEVPADSVFRSDNSAAYAIPTGSGKGWYNYNGTANLITPLPGKVIVIRTATGKYAKLEILNYYKGGQTPSSTASDDIKLHEQRYYTFRYVYQPNGTKKF